MSCFSGISLLSKCEIVALADSVSLALSEGLNNDDLNMLGNIFSIIGNFLMAFASRSQDTKGSE